MAAAPPLLNLIIPAAFAAYGAVLIVRGAQGGDGTPRSALAAGDLPGSLWRLIGVALIGSALTDMLILAANAAGAAYLQAWIISLYSSSLLLVIGLLSLSPAILNAPDTAEETALPPTAAEGEIMARLDALMAEAALHRDPDLTLARLARRLGIPAKQLSAAVNRTTGENVSRYINAARVSAAQNAIRAGRSITKAMLMSGFATKSNFNREFLRVTGASPTVWRGQQKERPAR
jgi:AraC-like DNA-binding protein